MLEIVRGNSTTQTSIADHLEQALASQCSSGTLYIGFPILPSADEPVVADAMLVCEDYGVVAFILPATLPLATDEHGWLSLRTQSLKLLTGIRSKLQKEPELCDDEGELTVRPRVAIFTPIATADDAAVRHKVTLLTSATVQKLANPKYRIATLQIRAVSSVLQSISTLRPRKRRANVTKPNSRGHVLREIEREINNLDKHQKKGALETPDGPQRIRGLAGSGKTVVLALKAAYLHALHQDWQIAIVFHTRSLQQQFQELVRRFSYEFIGTEPDFKNIHIMPAWGSEREPGFYYLVADAAQAAPLNFQEAKNQFGRDHAFEGACGTLLKHVEGMTHGVNDIAQYDVILIDEAQDLPQPFFELAYFAARPPKRIVWGYDELQNLSAFSMVGPEKLFGSHGDGEPRIQFTGNSPQKQDVILPVCYRNTPWALTTAHALGFGIYRKSGLVQYFDDESLWTEIGYEHVPGATVNPRDLAIRRSAKSTPPFFRSLIQPDDAVTTARFANKDAQYEWIAAQIASNIADDELALLRQIA